MTSSAPPSPSSASSSALPSSSSFTSSAHSGSVPLPFFRRLFSEKNLLFPAFTVAAVSGHPPSPSSPPSPSASVSAPSTPDHPPHSQLHAFRKFANPILSRRHSLDDGSMIEDDEDSLLSLPPSSSSTSLMADKVNANDLSSSGDLSSAPHRKPGNRILEKFCKYEWDFS